MSLASHDTETVTLLRLLSNPLILYQTVPFLPVSSLLALGATSRSFHDLIHCTPQVFRYLNLTQTKVVQFDIAQIDHGGEVWRNVQMDENVTEDDFYSGPLRGVFNNLRKLRILQDVQILVLDGLSVTSELVGEILLDPSFNIKILSIREVRNLNERKLIQAFHHAIRISRPDNTPKLRGLYVFGSKDPVPVLRSRRRVNKYPPDISPIDTPPSYGVTTSQGAQIGARWNQKSEDALLGSLTLNADKWYRKSGRVIHKVPGAGWAETLMACKGLIHFDAVLCNGPRHTSMTATDFNIKHHPWFMRRDAYLPPSVATFALKGCDSCHSAPEGWTIYGSSFTEDLPLLAPPPLHSSSVRVASRPWPMIDGKPPRLIARCEDCMRNRYCENCQKWWCEQCYEVLSDTYNPIQSVLGEESAGAAVDPASPKHGSDNLNVKVHMGLCVNECLVAEMMSGAGSNGMWG